MNVEASLRKNTFSGTFGLDGSSAGALDVHKIVFTSLGLRHDDLCAIQLEMGVKKFFVKLRSEVKFREVLARRQVNHTFGDGTTTTVKLEDAGQGVVTLRVFRLPPEVESGVVRAALARYGTVVDCYEEKWTKYEGCGLPNGVRGVKMQLQQGVNVPSYMRIKGIEAVIHYDGQIETCRKCNAEGHRLYECPKRAINQPGGRRWETANKPVDQQTASSEAVGSGEGGRGQPDASVQPAPAQAQPGPVKPNSQKQTKQTTVSSEPPAAPLVSTSTSTAPPSKPVSSPAEAKRDSGEGEGAGGGDESVTMMSEGEASEEDSSDEHPGEGGWQELKRKKKRKQDSSRRVKADRVGGGKILVPLPPRLTQEQDAMLDKLCAFMESNRPLYADDIDRATQHILEGKTCLEFFEAEKSRQLRLGDGLQPPQDF